MKHVHILGICGTFMAGIASIAKQAGWRVSGCDQNVYPPMSTLLEKLGIEVIQGFDSNQIKLRPDVFLIGNIVSRGNPLAEAILREKLPYQSAPLWLYDNVLKTRHVIAVSGTHGKTSTTAMLAHILDQCQNDCGFLIGGVAENFGLSARIGSSNHFVIEADEYDTAFFDKSAKFQHYYPNTLIINNLDFDHADIYPDIHSIIRQFHYLLRKLPDNALILCAHNNPNIDEVLAQGVWSNVERINSDWLFNQQNQLLYKGECFDALDWQLIGQCNRLNALAAIAAANHIGIEPNKSLHALQSFQHVKRRQQLRGEVHGISVYDDFAHHPSEIQATLSAFKEEHAKRNTYSVGTTASKKHETHGKIWAVFEPASNSMRQGVHTAQLALSFKDADEIIFFDNQRLEWDLNALEIPNKLVFDDLHQMIQHIKKGATTGDSIIGMSNGNFSNFHNLMLEQLHT